MTTNNDLQQMPAIDECYVKISDLKKAIERNPYDPEKGNITAYLRYLKYNTPLADAEPVRHGRWIERKSYPGVACYCSECNYKNYGTPYQNTYFIVPYNYCPNCGARMQEGEE